MEETVSKKKKVLDIIWIACIVAGFAFTLLVEYIPYMPAGHVIDDKFLNTLKWMTVIRYMIPIGAFGLLFGVVFTHWFKNGDKTRRVLVVMLTVLVIVVATVLIVLNARRGVRGLFETPSTCVKTVSDKNYSDTGMTYTIDFTDGSYAHVNNYAYRQIAVGDEVYVVYCDEVAIGVFPASKYELG